MWLMFVGAYLDATDCVLLRWVVAGWGCVRRIADFCNLQV